jgi:hypothetical protein
VHLELDALALQHRLDQLEKAARQDHGAVLLGELAEPRSDRDVLAHPVHRVDERQPQRPHLDRDHVMKR